MKSYVSEIDLLLVDVRDLETQYSKCYEDFDRDLPKAVKDQRKQRKTNSKANNNNLKRPAMLGTLKPGKQKTVDLTVDDSELNIY